MVYEGKYYGTIKNELQRIWNNEQVPVLDIDVKGAIHVQQQYPDSSLSLFIEPPSVDELKTKADEPRHGNSGKPAGKGEQSIIRNFFQTPF